MEDQLAHPGVAMLRLLEKLNANTSITSNELTLTGMKGLIPTSLPEKTVERRVRSLKSYTMLTHHHSSRATITSSRWQSGGLESVTRFRLSTEG
ncbi:hypothetical protein E2C01_022337 [Portunus trituberculatus]|uniref:Uncharacterized protein n=1 Tax=Portunus trituberculatus TaxID=210409 RepID=A0A5B7E6S6_PORTR|nr:hypothetical protein [Portunus trituberculatus]